MVLGAEYALLNDWLVVGALYTGRFAKPKTLNELTFSACIRPTNAFNVAASYSVLQGAGKTFGLALKLVLSLREQTICSLARIRRMSMLTWGFLFLWENRKRLKINKVSYQLSRVIFL